ncbi:hypothetical protein D3C80_904420 [compost metagenome]
MQIRDPSLEELHHLGVAQQLGLALVLQVDGAGVLLQGLEAGDDQRRDEVAGVGDDGDLLDEAILAQGPLHQLRRHVLAVGGLHQLLEALGEVDVALVVELAGIAGAQEAIGRHHLGGGVRLVVVAAHHCR